MLTITRIKPSIPLIFGNITCWVRQATELKGCIVEPPKKLHFRQLNVPGKRLVTCPWPVQKLMRESFLPLVGNSDRFGIGPSYRWYQSPSLNTLRSEKNTRQLKHSETELALLEKQPFQNHMRWKSDLNLVTNPCITHGWTPPCSSVKECRRLVHYRCTVLPLYQIERFLTKGYSRFICISCVSVSEYLKPYRPKFSKLYLIWMTRLTQQSISRRKLQNLNRKSSSMKIP